MYHSRMFKQRPTGLTSTLAFQLGVLGTTITDLFAARIAPLDLRPKHAGLLALLANGGARSPAEAAEAMGITPSHLAGLADRLQNLGAVIHERDPGDQSRQVLALTADGTTLLATCTQIAADIDTNLTADLKAEDTETLGHALSAMTGFEASAA